MAFEKGVDFPIAARDQFSGAFGKLTQSISTLESGFGRLGGVIAATMAGIGVAGFAGLIKSVLDAQDELAKLSQKVNVSVETLAGLEHAAQLSGASLDTLTKGLKSITTQAFDASMGLAESQRNFAALGITVRESNGALKSSEALLLEVSGKFEEMGNTSERSALAVKLFGKAGLDLIPMLAGGREELSKMIEEGKRLNPVTAESAAQAEIFNDNLLRLQKSVSAVGIALINDLLPVLSDLSKIFAEDALPANVDKTSKAVEDMTPKWSYFGEAIKAVVVLAGNVSFVLKGVGDTIGGLAAAAALFNAGDWKGARNVLAAMSDNAESARVAFDAWEKKILAAGTSAAAATPKVRGVAAAITDTAKAAADAQKEHDRLAKLDAAGWVRYIEETTKSYEEGLLDKGKALDEWRSNEARMLKMSDAEWVKYIEALQKKWEEELLDNAKTHEEASRKQQEMLREQAAVWNQLGDVAGSFFSDLVMNGKSAFDNLKRWVKDLLAQMIALFAKRWILNMAAGGSVMGAAGSALASGAGDVSAVGSLFSAGSALGGVYSGFTGASALAGAGASTAGSLVAAPGMITSGISAEGIGASLYEGLAAIGPYGWIAIAVIAVAAWMSGRGGGPKEGGSFFGSYDASGNLTGTPAVPGTDNGRFFTPSQGDEQMRRFTTSVAEGFYQTLERYGGTAAGMQFGFGYDKDPAGTADSRVSAMVRDASGNVVYSHTQSAGRDDEDFNQAIALETRRAIVAALGVSDIDESIKQAMGSFDIATASIEDLDAALQRADIAFATLSLGIKGLDYQSLEAFQLQGEGIADTFTRIAGVWSWFTDNFYTEAEKLEMATDDVNEVFATLGIEVPDSITGFRQLVESIDLSTESGRAMWTMLINVAPAFLTVANATSTAADTIVESATHITEAQRALNEELGYSGIPLAERVRREQQKIVDAKMGLQGYLGGLLLNSGTSPLTLDQKVAEAGSQFHKLLGMAQGGDLGAINDVQGAFSSYLDLARQRYGSSGAYNSIFTEGFDALRGVAGGGPTWQTSLQTALPTNSTISSSADIQGLRDEVSTLLSLIAKGQFEAAREVAAQIEETGDKTTAAVESNGGGVL